MAYSLITLKHTKSPVSEAFRTLRTNFQFTSVDLESKKVMITSAGPGEGKSTTAANLAVSIAQTGKSVLIVDADLRNPTQHKFFSLNNGEGLSSSMVQDQEFQYYIRETAVPGISVLPGGPVPPNPAELVGSKRMKRLLEEVSKQFDIVLIDTPPIIAVTDAAILAQEVDGVILVLASGEVQKDYAKKAKELLDKVNAKILGVVLNKADAKTGDYYYYYYYGSDNQKKKHKRHKNE